MKITELMQWRQSVVLWRGMGNEMNLRQRTNEEVTAAQANNEFGKNGGKQHHSTLVDADSRSFHHDKNL